MKTSNKSPFFSGNFDKLAYRLTLLFALVIPAAETLVLEPLSTVLLANGIGGAIFYELFSRVCDLALTAAFLCQCTLIVCAVFADKRRLAARLFWIEAVSFLAVVIVKPLVLWINAMIDEYVLLGIGDFVLSDLTLAQIEDNLLAVWAVFSNLMNVLMLFAVMLTGYVAAHLKIRAVRSTGRKFSHEMLVSELPKNRLVNTFIAIPTGIYLLSQLVYPVGDTVETLKQHSPTLISDYIAMIMPYVYLILTVVVSYYICQYVAYIMISSLDEKTSKK